MSFLEDLENNKKEENLESTGKTPKQLWESCFKYFQQFTTILQKEDKSFDSEFNFTFLNLKRDCVITGPYEIKRSHIDKELKLEIKFMTNLTKAVNIKRKDKRSADLLSSKLSKDTLLSNVKLDAENNYTIELNPNITSFFKIILKNETDFFVEYINIASSTRRSIRLPLKNINEEYMEGLAKYIVGKNPGLYTEKISNQDITKIREKMNLAQKKIIEKDEEIQAEIERNKERKAIEKANTIKEKSKKYISSKSKEVKNKFYGKIMDTINKYKK